MKNLMLIPPLVVLLVAQPLFACISVPQPVTLGGSSFETLPFSIANNGSITIEDDEIFYDINKKQFCLKPKGESPICSLSEGEVLRMEDTSVTPKRLVGIMTVSHRDRQLTLNSVNSNGEIDRDKPYIRFVINAERRTGGVGGVNAGLKAEAYDKVGGTTIGEVKASGFFYIDDDGRLRSPARGISFQEANVATNMRNKSINVGECGGTSVVDYKKTPSLKVDGQPANGSMSIR